MLPVFCACYIVSDSLISYVKFSCMFWLGRFCWPDYLLETKFILKLIQTFDLIHYINELKSYVLDFMKSIPKCGALGIIA